MHVWRQASASGRSVAAVALLAALAALPAPGRAEPAACRLQLSVAPRTLGAGQVSAQLLVFGAGRAPRLAASAGTVEDVRRETGETFAARYLPPRDRLVRTVVIGAVLDDGGCGLVTLRLADAPGTTGAPPLPAPVAVAIPAPPHQPDGELEVQAWIFAVDDAGAPRVGAPPVVRVGVGTIAAAEPACPGVWTARWRVPAGRAAEEQLTATFPGGSTGSARLGRRLASLEVELDPGRVVRGAVEPVAVIVRGFDDARRPADAEVALSATAGTLGALERVDRGVYLASLVVRPGTHAGGAVTVRARAGPIQGEALLTFGPGEPATLRLDGPEALVCDGTSSMLIVTVADAQGNPVDDPEPTLEARQADLGPPHHAGPGQWWVAYRPRCTAVASRDEVVARAGPATGRRAIRLAAPASGVGLGPKVGLALQQGGAGLSVAAEGAAWTRLGGGASVGLLLEVGRWSLTSRGTLDGLGAYADERTYLPVLLSGGWQRPLQGQLLLWVTVGGGAAQVATSNQLSAQPAVAAAGWAPAASGAVSLGRWATHGLTFVEARGTWIGDPGLPTLHGALTSLLLQAGYRFHGW